MPKKISFLAFFDDIFYILGRWRSQILRKREPLLWKKLREGFGTGLEGFGKGLEKPLIWEMQVSGA